MRVMKSMIHPLESTTLYEQHVPGGASAEYARFAQQRGQRADACADTSTSVPHPLAYIEMGVPTPPRHLVPSFTTATSGAYAVGTWMQQSSIMINVFRVDIFKCRGSRSAAEEARHTKQIVNQVHEAAAPGRI